jgi:hypothetical protein
MVSKSKWHAVLVCALGQAHGVIGPILLPYTFKCSPPQMPGCQLCTFRAGDHALPAHHLGKVHDCLVLR